MDYIGAFELHEAQAALGPIQGHVDCRVLFSFQTEESCVCSQAEDQSACAWRRKDMVEAHESYR